MLRLIARFTLLMAIVVGTSVGLAWAWDQSDRSNAAVTANVEPAAR